jgi:MICOS complex subunit MIC60
VAGVPLAPILQTATTPAPAVAPSDVPKTPPTPAQVQSTPPAPSTNTGNLPPTGTGTASTGPSSAPPPKRPRRRFRNFLLTLVLLTSFGYAGGVYYSLVNDNFHDFFTEYVPYGEDAVAYFEEREYKRRFPTKEYSTKQWPQLRGENKVTIGRQSGISPRVAEETKETDLGQKGRHISAVEDNNKPQPGKAQQTPDATSAREKTKAVEDAKKGQPAQERAKEPESTVHTLLPKDEKPAPAATAVDHINMPNATEPAVQELVKLVNNIITAVNASPEASKFGSTLQSLKGDLNTVISQIGALKDTTTQEAQKKIQEAHAEFDNAAKELVRRVESEMREQEAKWREEYETERERLSQSYQQRLQAEIEAAKKVEEERRQSALLQQEIALQKAYMDNIKAKVEEEREGRLAKLDELSSSVQELEKLTSEWNQVVDAALQTQHLQVAVEAVRAKVLESEHPTPFLNELVALKEVNADDDVVNAAVASIPPVAYQRGIPTPASLIDRFRRVASEVRKASLLPEDAGVASHAASALLSRLMFQKKSDRGLPEGDDVEATLARTEVLLEEGDLDAAAREMNGLKGWAGVLSRDWVAECRRVLEVRQAVEVSSRLHSTH